MPLAARLMQFFNRHGVAYRQLHHSRVGSLTGAVQVAAVAPENVVRAEVLIDAKGVMMAILPLVQELDLEIVNRQCKRSFQLLPAQQVDRLFQDCEPGSHPPLPGAYGLPAILDESLVSKSIIYCQSGCHNTLLQVDGDSFQQMTARALRVRACCRGFKGKLMGPSDNVTHLHPNLNMQRVSERLKQLYKLPPMPAVGARIMQIVADPDSSVRELARVIEQDPSLTAQVMRYARSALFNYRGQIRNVQDAVNIVLGFDRVCHLAMGLAASRSFDIPQGGPLGLNAFWKHALHTSFLSQQLANHAPKALGIEPATAYLAGLLHNFGILLIGHLFRPEFTMLNKLSAAEPETPLTTLEKQVFGMGGAQELIGLGHGLIGSILLEHWNMPAEICKVAAVHHDDSYQGEYAPYVHCVQLANSLLKDLAIGDDLNPEDPKPLMEAIGLAPEVAYEIFRQTQENTLEIQSLAEQLAAA